MSERDPSVKNVINPNFNFNIYKNGLTVVNMSATTSMNSQYSENSRTHVHLYAPELTRAFDTTHTSTTDGIQTKPMMGIFIKTFQDKDMEFPTTNSPPTYIPSIMNHEPFLQHDSDLDSRTNPNAALLYYLDATLQDNINGPLTMQHLPACVDTSITAATFCLLFISTNVRTVECIRDLTTDHLRHFFRELHPVLLVNDATISDNDDSIEYIKCMQHTLNRRTNLVMDNLLLLRCFITFLHGTSASNLSLLNDHQPGSLGDECALAILYALKILHLIYFLTFPATTQDAPYKYMPHDLSDIIRNVPSFATTISLFLNRSNFRDVPAFIHAFFQDQQATNFDRQQDSQRSFYNEQPMYLGSSSLIAFTHSPLVNSFGNPTSRISPRSSLVARHLTSAALQHYASISSKVTNSDDPDLQPTNIILGHLPPADMLLNHLCSAFPMATQPTTEQLKNAPQPTNPATTLAVNFVICQDLSTNQPP